MMVDTRDARIAFTEANAAASVRVRRFTQLAQDTAQSSDHIIAVSQYTAGRVAELLSYPHSRKRPEKPTCR